MTNVGGRVKALRRARDWTQAELGRRAGGLPQGTIAKVERDDSNPTQDTLDKLARAFGITVSELLGEADTLGGPAPVANWRAWGVNEEQVQRYAKLWPALNRRDRDWLNGQLQLFAQAEIQIRRLEAQANTQAEPASQADADPPVTDDEPDPIRQYARMQV